MKNDFTNYGKKTKVTESFGSKISAEAQRLYDFLPPNCWMTTENLAKAIKVRKARLTALKDELEAARMIDIYFYPNGKRSNPKHEIVKRSLTSGNSICKHIKKAYCFVEWDWLDRNNLIECYLKSNWNIVPLEPREKRIIKNFCAANWKQKSAEKKMDFFYDNPKVGVGLVNCHFTVVDAEAKNNEWSQHRDFYNTLTVSTARGFHYYLRSDPVIKTSAKVLPDIDTRCKNSLVVLPPTIHPLGKRYEWETLCIPRQLPIEFRREWRQKYFESYGDAAKFNLPHSIPEGMRNDTLWRYGRSLRCAGRNFYELEAEIRSINNCCCQPPLSSIEVERLIKNIWERPDKFSFRKKGY